QSNSGGVGWEFIPVAIDDATRLAYVELPPDGRRASATGFPVRALRLFRARGGRVMTDNGSASVSRLFVKALRWLKIRQIRNRPYAPKTNGDAERFIHMRLREGADTLPYRYSESRSADPPR
ncbi:MAG: IS481 family transposase, partial [Pseudomonadota bacterium]